MKTKIFRPLLSLMAIALTIFGSFAFTTAPEKSAALGIWGLIPANDCEVSTVECGTDISKPFCKSGTIDLYDMNASQTDCTVRLHRLN